MHTWWFPFYNTVLESSEEQKEREESGVLGHSMQKEHHEILWDFLKQSKHLHLFLMKMWGQGDVKAVMSKLLKF